MCGIFGIIYQDQKRQLNPDKILAIKNHLKKRGPDHQGHFSQPGVSLIQTRLAILDLEARSNQPFFSSCGRYVIVYNGEVYNFLSLKTDLINAGYRFTTTSDTEVVLASYLNYGVNCFRRFEGMFALAIYDLKTGECLLARDPAGIKPLYYFLNEEKIVFASDIRSLCLSEEVPLEPNQQAIFHYLHFGFAGIPQTFLKNVWTLPPGCYFSTKSKKTIKYFEVSLTEQITDLEEAQNKFEEIFTQSVQNSLVSDVDVAVLLSGGIDSGLIAAKASQIHPTIKSYSLGFDEKSYDETSKAKAIAQQLRIQHEVIPFRDNWREFLSEYVRDVSDPIADSSMLATHYLCQQVSQKHKVVLSGDGADELFGGYELYRYECFKQRAKPLFNLAQVGFKGINRFFKAKSSKNSYTNRIKRILSLSSKDFVESHLFLRNIWNTFDVTSILADDLVASATLSTCGHLFAEKLNENQDADLLSRSLYADFSYHLPGDMLIKVDRSSMAYGLEVRVPFLNSSMINFAFSLSSKLKVNGFSCQSKFLLRQQFEKLFGKKLAQQKKSGFSVPLRTFFDDWIHTKEWDEFGVSLDALGIFNRDWKDKVKRAFVLKEHQIENGLFSLLILDKWLAEYFS